MTVTYRTQSQTAIQRDAWIEINLSAIERNFKKLNALLKTSIMAVVKADAYGHGATTISPILQSLGVHSFGVATVDEGIELRKAQIKVPVLILGATPNWAHESCFENNLTITIHSVSQLDDLENFSKKVNSPIKIQLKIDTGMNRLGVSIQEAQEIITRITASKHFILEGIFSHLSCAEDFEFSKKQNEKFTTVLSPFKTLKTIKHIANSYAAINYPDLRHNLVRLGIALYGEEFNFLVPVISLKGRITQIHEIQTGESVSYERTWIAKKRSIIATVPIGYADGIDRRLSNNLSGNYKNTKVCQVGIITMDQMMFDISQIKDPKVGDIITLLDKELSISLWAKFLNTISYELLCRLKIRLPRVYTRD